MNKKEILDEITALILEGNKIAENKFDFGAGVIKVNAPAHSSWYTKVLTFIRVFLNQDSDFIKSIIKCEDSTFQNSNSIIAILFSLKDYIEKGIIVIGSKKNNNVNQNLEVIFNKFHKMVRQLRNRYDNRETLDVKDEYDVQDFIHVLLHLYFSDIRREEWTPSYAGGCSRVDFLLKDEKIVIEIKKINQSINDKKLGEQLIIDIEKYKAHPDCNSLICFIYDPEGLLGNPDGIVNDLSNQHHDFLRVIVEPK